jgi:parallel beta-helix repeat protein
MPLGTRYPYSIYPLRDRLAIYGGFAGTESTRSQRNWTNHVTVLEAGLSVIDADSTDTGPLSAAAVLDGFTVAAGNGGHPSATFYNSSPTLQNCVFRGPLSLIRGASPTLINCNVSGQNQGIYVADGCAPLIQNCLFTGDTNAIFCQAGVTTVFDSVFTSNNVCINNYNGSVNAARSIFRASQGNAIVDGGTMNC